MKVSAKEKEQTRVRLLEAAVDVITEKGFRSASMREIARRAEVGDATIYNYFPSKEKLLYGYCEHVQRQVINELKSIDDFHEYTLKEQLHQFIETQLQQWLPAREFLKEVFELTYVAPVAGYERLQPTRELFTASAIEMLEAAIEAGEIPDQPYKEILPRLCWDYMSAVLAYWLADETEQFSNTTQLVDQSVEIAFQLLKGGLIGTAVKIGLNRLHSKARNSFGSTDVADALDEKSALQLFEALTKLRGTAIKLAQMLGMESGLLPETLQKELEKSWHQVPPLNRVLVRKVMLEEFGQPPDQLFGEFQATAFAAASLGQVHAAQLPDGNSAAVKIQYPGIHVAMQSDIKLLRKLVKGLGQQKVVTISIDEIEARLTEELDYYGEAQRTEWFRKNITTDGISVPRVYTRFSTARVLTTELLEGAHLDAWLQTKPDQDTRDKTAQRIYDCFIHCVRDLRQLHADPNPGNFLFRDDGTIALVDFGCTRTLSRNFVTNLPVLLQTYLNEDKEGLRTAYANLGMNYQGSFDDAYEQTLKPFGNWLTLPFETECFDFEENSDYTTNARHLIQGMSQLKDQDYIAEEFIFFDRTVYGLCKIFERLKARVRMRHHWEPHWELQ